MVNHSDIFCLNSSNHLLLGSILRFGTAYMFYFGIFNLIFGLLGNILCIFVFKTISTFRQNQSGFYIMAESCSNIVLLTCNYSSRILAEILGRDPILFSRYWCKIRMMLMQTSGLSSIYIITFSSFDQFLTTNIHYRWRRRSTMMLTRSICFTVPTFFFLHSICFLMTMDIHIQPSNGCDISHPIMKKYYAYVYYPIIASSLPLILTIIFSFMAFYSVRHIIQLRIPVVRRRLDRQMTALVLGRVVLIVSFGIPYILAALVKSNLEPRTTNNFILTIADLITMICYTLSNTNFAVSFI